MAPLIGMAAASVVPQVLQLGTGLASELLQPGGQGQGGGSTPPGADTGFTF